MPIVERPMTQPPILTIMRYAYKPPWWLKRGARIDFDVLVRDLDDAYVLRATYMDGSGYDADFRVAEDRLTGAELRASLGRGGNEAHLVDMVLAKMKGLLAVLRPSTPTDEMIDLAMQAIQESAALDVLTDALLEDGTLSETPGSAWTNPGMVREYLSKQARAWAMRHIEERWTG